MRENRPTVYLVLARSKKQVEEWMQENKIHPRSCRFVQKMEDVRGVGDFSLILFSGWEEGTVGNYALTRAKEMFFADTHKPHVNGQGIITYWERREDADTKASRV